ncbi:ferritin-like domain-containing protein [Aureivirga sp. CE67]|uniref:ferritin-like domain-containing protein n=1 Tax=Aureivirga sp. CE67 TaxID=1788983 RepID=UPI0018CBC5B0|nr:ferritin-like domain-containing protein [Aureivirga sp. CE67]
MIAKDKLYKTVIDLKGIKQRDPKYKQADISCIQSIAQAAINVELFTIPLYMTALYSIQGMHQITSKDSTLYQGRWWPGAAATPKLNESDELTKNETVFNKVFSVFIEEMLHLQLASNMSSKLGFTPTFTSPLLQNSENGWICYGMPNGARKVTTIPHILDFKDCVDDLNEINPKVKEYFEKIFPGQNLQNMEVNLNAMTKEQALLFMIIEETEDNAKKIIKKEYWEPPYLKPELNNRPKYFEHAPYDWWQEGYTEADLPMFGSIGSMYLNYWTYLEIVYEDGTSLLELLLGKGNQKNYFNRIDDGHPREEYPNVDGDIDLYPNLNDIKFKFMNMINAITSQGEGGEGVVKEILETFKNEEWAIKFNERLKLSRVAEPYRPSKEGLEKDYVGYDDEGKEIKYSGNAYARFENGAQDHFEIFTECLGIIVNSKEEDPYTTWIDWHEKNGANPWKAEMLVPNENRLSKYSKSIPSGAQIADSLNTLAKPENIENTYELFSQSAVGTLKGLTMALNEYWSNPNGEFPSPAMGGSGDRISICWASTGKIPDLTKGIGSIDTHNNLFNACQGMTYPQRNESVLTTNTLPDPAVFHSCKGSNSCRAQGGCGFVQPVSGGGSCGGNVSDKDAYHQVSSPANNKCGMLGGCAVPISASQLYPKKVFEKNTEEVMQLFNFKWDGNRYENIPMEIEGKPAFLEFKEGDKVYDIAWKAYSFANKELHNFNSITEQKFENSDDKDSILVSGSLKPEKMVFKNDPNNFNDAIRMALPPST